MIVVTTETIAGKKIVRTLGMARGNTIRARHLGKDISAVFRSFRSSLSLARKASRSAISGAAATTAFDCATT